MGDNSADGYSSAIPYAINSQADMVGLLQDYEPTGFGDYYSDNEGMSLTANANGSYSSNFCIQYPASANAINDSGQIVGSIANTAVYWSTGNVSSTPTTLGNLSASGNQATANGINNEGQIVGNSVAPDGVNEGYLWTAAGGMVNLNSLVGTSPPYKNMGLSNSGQVINDWGQIAVSAAPTGVIHALLLSPTVPMITATSSHQISHVVSGLKYKQIPAFTNGTLGSLSTAVTFLSGTATTNVLESAQFQNNPSSTTQLASDCVTLTGSGTDAYAVQISYDPSTAATLFGNAANARLCRYQGQSWIHNAVDSDAGGATNFAGNRAYSAATDFQLGRYGVDTVNHVVWAVINHTGTFGVAMDPGTLKTLKSYTLSGATSTLKIDGYTGYTFTLQKTAALTGTWSSVGSTLVGHTGNVLTYANTASATQQFYRILVGP